MRLGRRAALAAIAAGIVGALLVPGTAWAPRVKGLPGYIDPCTMEISGVEEDGIFIGDVFVMNYEAKDDAVVANLSLTGSCRVGEVAQGVIDAPVAAPLTFEKSNCQKLNIRLGDIRVRDLTLDLSTTTMSSAADKHDKAGKSLLCAIAKSLKKGSPAQTAGLLNVYFAE